MVKESHSGFDKSYLILSVVCKAILEKGREAANKVVFLITDGFSNGGDPRPAADLLKNTGATVFTFGIRTGNVEELHDIASHPGYTHSYLLDSFAEFEALARRALHRGAPLLENYIATLFHKYSECVKSKLKFRSRVQAERVEELQSITFQASICE